MASFEDGEYHWRESYFVLFPSARRPTLAQVEKVLRRINRKYELHEPAADDDGNFESVTLVSRDDHAALEINFESGDAVLEQTADLAKQLKGEATPAQLEKVKQADARLDVMHFEHVDAAIMTSGEDDDDFDEVLDPSCLLQVVDALVALTKGLPVDPSSGAIMP